MTIHIEDRQSIMKLNRRQVRKEVQFLLKKLQLGKKELSLVFMDNQGIQEMNRAYLDRDRPTNVISFAMQEGEFTDVQPDLLGDIVISTERAMSDAAEGNIPVEDELSFLIIHGLLHLVGYDHESCTETESMRMREKEQELFQAMKGYQLDLD